VLYIVTVNAHRDKDLDCLIELRGCKPQKYGRVFELNAKDVNACNDKNNKNNIKVERKPDIEIRENFTYTFPAHCYSYRNTTSMKYAKTRAF